MIPLHYFDADVEETAKFLILPLALVSTILLIFIILDHYQANTRFINYGINKILDERGFVPVVSFVLGFQYPLWIGLSFQWKKDFNILLLPWINLCIGDAFAAILGNGQYGKKSIRGSLHYVLSTFVVLMLTHFCFDKPLFNIKSIFNILLLSLIENKTNVIWENLILSLISSSLVIILN